MNKNAAGESLVIVTGMTGGHFFPALSFAESYLSLHPDFEIHFLIPRENNRFNLEHVSQKIFFHRIPIDPFPRSFSLKLFSFLVHYLRAFAATFKFLFTTKPRILIGFGSYGSFPGVLCAWCLGIPVVLHEQNRVAGWANRFASFFARHVAVSFPDTAGIVARDKIKKVGYPLRREILESAARKADQRSGQGATHVLILGGSQGAQAINEAILAVFDKLSVEEKKKLAVIHITGDAQYSAVLKRYQANGIQHQVFAFSNEMHRWYEQADLVISRSGAGTVFELIEFNLRAILIPYPFAHSHQLTNAKYLEEKKMAVVIEQKELTTDRLQKALFEMMQRIHDKSEEQKTPYRSNQNFIELVDQLR